MGIAILPQHELIDLIETVSPDLAPEHAELLCRIGAAMEGIA